MTAPDTWTDPELEDLFRKDRALHQTARVLRASRPEPVVDPEFQERLRVQLMQAAAARPARAGSGRVRTPRPVRAPRRPFWMRLRAGHLAWGGAALGVALTAVTVVALVIGSQAPGRTQTIVATSPVAADHLVSPNNTILVSFNQPMNHAAVESGLRIEPATQVATAWQGDQLMITPVHHLAGNTPYTVTIPQTSLVAASGAHATTAVTITFGTAPTPPPPVGSSLPPQLTQVALGSGQGTGVLLFAPDGGVVTNAPAPTTTAPTPTPSASPTAAPTATASPTPASATAIPTSSSAPVAPGGSSLVELPAQQGSPLALAAAASAAAFSPDSRLLASAAPASGGSDITVSRADGSDGSTVTRSTAPVVAIAWTSTQTIEYATAQTVKSVDLSGTVSTVATNPSGAIAGLAPGGAVAYLSPSGAKPGRLLTLVGGAVASLDGNKQADDVAFSGDGSTVAWVDRSSSNPVLRTKPTSKGAAAPVSILDPGSGLDALALNRDGSEVAYDEVLGSGTGRLVVAQLPSGSPVAIGDGVAQLAFSPGGDALAVLVASPPGVTVALDKLPGAVRAGGALVPTAATQALRGFLDAQVAGNAGALHALSAPGVVIPSLSAAGLSRALLIDAVQRSDGTVDATAELLVDPSASRPTILAAAETLTLVQGGGSYVVSSVSASALHALATGPHVISVSSARQHATLTAEVSFDSDLAPESVASAITVQDASGATVPAAVTYDENTRTATVTVASNRSGALSLVVGTELRDVNGQSPMTSFSAALVGG